MSRCYYCNEEILTGNSFEHPGVCDKCHIEDQNGKLIEERDNAELKLGALEKRATKNFGAYMRCSKKYTELTERFEQLEKAKAQELADYLHTSIPKCIVDDKEELLEKAKARVKNIRFNGLRENIQKLIKISVCYEIDQLIRELNAQYGKHKISKNAQKEK